MAVNLLRFLLFIIAKDLANHFLLEYWTSANASSLLIYNNLTIYILLIRDFVVGR
jgi:hypothetical protein